MVRFRHLIMARMSYKRAWQMVEKRELLGNSPYWASQCSGRVLAFEATKQGSLPHDFDGWHCCDAMDWTLAHYGAQWGYLSNHFDGWYWVNHTGWTVTHYAALSGTLPPHLDQWHLKTRYGITVQDVALNLSSNVGTV